MKESLWGYWIIILGIFILTVMMLFNNYTTTNEQDYILIKEVTEASMADAIDWSHFRKYGEMRIVKEKFVEDFTRRFAETVNINNCPKLKKVIFNIGSIAVKDITINNCISVNVITSNTEETGLVDLTTLTSLQYLDLQNCSSITSVKLPANVTLRDYGLA